MWHSVRYKFKNFLKMLSLVRVWLKRLVIPLAYLLCIIISCHYFIEIILVNTTRAQQLSFPSTNISDRVHQIPALAQKESSRNSRIRLQRRSIGKSHSSSNQHKHHHHDSRRSNSTKVWASNTHRVTKDAKIFYPWIGDKECETFFVHFAPNKTFKPRALVSFPGSGNSWLRYLIDSSSGYFTGSVFHDKNVFKSGLLGEYQSPNSGNTIVQKTHHDSVFVPSKKLKAYIKLSELMFGYRGILLIRNPFDALVSFWNFKKTANHKGYATKPHLHTPGWKQFITLGIKKWSSLIMTWIKNSDDFMIVKYEDLKKNPKEELTVVLKYLDQPVESERLKCVLKHLEGPFHRKRKEQISSKNEYSDGRKYEDTSTITSQSNDDLNSNDTETLFKLDLIIQQHINEINLFLEENSIPVFLNYTGSLL